VDGGRWTDTLFGGGRNLLWTIDYELHTTFPVKSLLITKHLTRKKRTFASFLINIVSNLNELFCKKIITQVKNIVALTHFSIIALQFTHSKFTHSLINTWNI